MVKKVLLILLIMLLIPMAFAHDIEVVIQTTPGSQVDFKVLNNEGKILDSINGVFSEIAGSDGKVNIIYSAENPFIKASVSIKKGENFAEFKQGNKTKTLLVYNNLMTQGVNSINLLNLNNPELTFERHEKEDTVTSEEVEEEVEEEVIEEEENTNEEEIVKEEIVEKETEESVESDSKLTGAVIGGVKSMVTSKTTYFLVGGLFFALLIVFVLRKTVSKKGKYLDFKIKSDKPKVDFDDEKLSEIEGRIEGAKKELEEIKNKKKKLEEAKERFKKDKEELEKLERE